MLFRSIQAQQQADAQWQSQQANLARDQAAVLAVSQQTTVLKAELEKAQAALLTAQAEQARVELDLSRTHVTAPASGIVTQRTVRVGQLAQPGKPVLTVVPVQALYVEANFRETQLANVKVGQPVQIKVDALPGKTLQGKVASLGPASGVSLSGMPAHNATGNFTKIVQRLPIRIELDPGQTAASQIGRAHV